MLDHGLRVHGRLRVGGELAHRRRAAEALGAGAQLASGSARRCSACGCPRGTRRGAPDRYRRSASTCCPPPLRPFVCRTDRVGRAATAGEYTRRQPPSADGHATYTPARGGNAAVMKLALAAARATAFASRASGRGGGTTLPGRVLTALAPDAPRRLAARLPRGCVLVSATNGKTTTCALLAEVLRGRVQLARNSAGANLASGIASALAVREAATAELGLFECDEAALPAIADQLHPSAIALGNLFRDQLDRYGELELVAARWRDLIAEPPARDDARRRRRRSAHRLARRAASDRRALRDRRSVGRPRGDAPRRRRALLRALRARLRLPRDLRRAPQRLLLPELRQRTRPARPGRARDRPARPRRHGLRSLPRRRARPRRARAAGPLQRRERARSGRSGGRPGRAAGRDRRGPRPLPRRVRALPAAAAWEPPSSCCC